MIPKGNTVVVNFYATNSDGIPLSTAAGITPYYRYIGSTGLESNSIACNIYSVGSDAPGWFYFSTNSFATSDPGNLFITFRNSSGYIIAPWEDDIVQVGEVTASDIWDHSFSGNTASAYLYNASVNAYSAYTAANGLPDTSAITLAVWGPQAYNQIQSIKDLQSVTESFHTAIEQIVPDVWGYAIGNSSVSASTYLGSIGSIPHDVWNYNLERNTPVNPDRITGDLLSAIPSSSDIGSLVWGSSFMEEASYLNIEPNELIIDYVWTYSEADHSTAYSMLSVVPTANDIASSVWRYNISNAAPAVAASTYLRSTYGLPSRVWSHSWGTPTAVSAYSYLTSIYNNTSSITIPTPPTTGEIATSVWAHTSRSITTTLVNDGAAAGNETYIATGSNVSGIPSAVWTYNIGPDTTTASTYLGSIGAIPTTSSIATSVWTYSTEGNPSSDRSLTYYPAFPTVPTVESIWDYSVNNVSMKSYMVSTDGIAANVWTQTSRSLTTDFIDDGSTTDHHFARLEDIPGKDEIAGSVWNYGIPQVNDSPIRMSSYLISTYNNTSSISIPTVPTASEIAESVWTYSTTGNPSSDRSLTYYPDVNIPAFPPLNDIADAVWSHSLLIGPIEQLTYVSMESMVRSIYNNTSDITIPTPPDTGAIATSVWNYGDGTTSSRTVDNMLTSANVWSYQIDGSAASTLLGSIGVPPSAAAIATSVWTYGDDDLTGNTIRVVDASTIWGFSVTRGITASSVLSTVFSKVVVVLPSSISALSAGLFNWRVTGNKLVTSIGTTEVEYSISRDINSNIIGITPYQQ